MKPHWSQPHYRRQTWLVSPPLKSFHGNCCGVFIKFHTEYWVRFLMALILWGGVVFLFYFCNQNFYSQPGTGRSGCKKSSDHPPEYNIYDAKNVLMSSWLCQADCSLSTLARRLMRNQNLLTGKRLPISMRYSHVAIQGTKYRRRLQIAAWGPRALQSWHIIIDSVTLPPIRRHPWLTQSLNAPCSNLKLSADIAKLNSPRSQEAPGLWQWSCYTRPHGAADFWDLDSFRVLR